jgi:CRP-like cAMP-binding protein
VIDKHLMKLRARDEIDAREEAVIRAAVKEVIEFPADATIVRANTPVDASMILLSGIACRQKDLRDGRRQITELHVPGDFTDLHSFTLKYLDHDVAALSDCALAVVPHERVQAITEEYPHLARVYWFGTNLDGAVHREWELSLGRRSALARMAHLFCELFVRLEIVKLVEGLSYQLPLTQIQLAECLGITGVHANRTLQELRATGAVDFTSGRVIIHDFAALKRTAEFDPAYLYLDRRRR